MSRSAAPTHDFAESLAMSHRASDWPGWEPLYRGFFPTMLAMHDHRQDGDHQRAGIDRTIVLQNAKVLYIDEKVRGRNKKTGRVYDDISIEVFSDMERRKEGWVSKPLQADFIAYLIAPLGKCYLLPVLQLQLAWSRYGQDWTAKAKRGDRGYFVVSAANRGWTTVSVAMPPDELFKRIGGALRATCEAWEPIESGQRVMPAQAPIDELTAADIRW